LRESARVLGRVGAAGGTAMGVLAAISFCPLLNDMMQSLLPAPHVASRLPPGAHQISRGGKSCLLAPMLRAA
jgi:hypothetical protein